MNYRHVYHAGNFADVCKHIILTLLIQSLLKKEKSFCYLDTHSGMGFYDLLSTEAQKSQEFTHGIGKIWALSSTPDFIEPYINAIKKINPDNNLRYYPGSPLLVRTLLRNTDRMILSEYHPEEFQALKKKFSRDKQVAIHHQDGYLSLKAFLPPKENRGLVLIDPPYEKMDEFSKLLTVLPESIKRWENGIYTLWYPLKNRASSNRFLQKLKEKIQRPYLIVEFSIFPPEILTTLTGCGIVIVNPPWHLEENLKKVLPWLWQTLQQNKLSGFSIQSVNVT